MNIRFHHEKSMVLTDIEIPESPLWRERTLFIGDIGTKIPEPARRRLLPLLQAVSILSCLRRYDCVITADIRTAQLLGFIRTFFRLDIPKHIVLELMLDEEDEGLLWRLKRKLQRYIFSSVDVIFVSATPEIESYAERLRKPRSCIKFLPFHTDIVEPRILTGGEYILSAGRTGRDYKVIADAVADLDVRVIIISDKASVDGIHFPSNVTVLIDVPYPRYLETLTKCRFVVIPLKKLTKSTGQVAFLEAMALGKPVIATDTVGTKDYIRPGVDGLLVPPEDPAALREAITTLLGDPGLEHAISVNAFELVKKRHTFDKYCGAILSTADDLIKESAVGTSGTFDAPMSGN